MVTHPTKRSSVALNQAIEIAQGILPHEFESWDEVPQSLLPTPTLVDMGRDKTPEEWEAWTAAQKQRHGNGNGHGASLNVELRKLLPTPNTMEHLPARQGEARERQLRRGGDESRRTASGNLREDILDLLPTTRTSMKNGATAKEVEAGNPKARLEAVTNWGKFEPAIRRWEAIIGRAAPAATKPDGKDGAHRLSSEFTEWMMGLPAGWITDCGLTRNEELKACGNGVVPQQAALALRMMLDRIETAGRTNQPG